MGIPTGSKIQGLEKVIIDYLIEIGKIPDETKTYGKQEQRGRKNKRKNA